MPSSSMRTRRLFGRRKSSSTKSNIGSLEWRHVCSVAFAYQDEGSPGSYCIQGYDEKGHRMTGSAKYVDAQSDAPKAAFDILRLASSVTSEDERDASEAAQDNSTSITDRVAALQEWIIVDNDAASEFILEQLERQNLQPEWCNALIYSAEDIRLPEASDRQRLCTRLREIALDMLEQLPPAEASVVWSAIRRFASLVPEERAGELVTFLYQKSQIDTRLVALEGVVTVFHSAPPATLMGVERLSDRIFELTNKVIDSDIMTAGEISAIAEKGIHALAAIGDHRLEAALSKLKSLGWQWLRVQVRADLCELKTSWEEREQQLASHPAFQQLKWVVEIESERLLS